MRRLRSEMSQTCTSLELIDAEVFLATPDTKGFELIDGGLREKARGARSSNIGLCLGARLFGPRRSPRPTARPCLRGRNRLSVLPRPSTKGPQAGCIIPPSRSPTQGADGVDWRAARLAVEVVSPGDLYSDLEGRVIDLLEAGPPCFGSSTHSSVGLGFIGSIGPRPFEQRPCTERRGGAARL